MREREIAYSGEDLWMGKAYNRPTLEKIGISEKHAILWLGLEDWGDIP